MNAKTVLALLALICSGNAVAMERHEHHGRRQAVAPPREWSAYPLIEAAPTALRERAIFEVKNLAVAGVTVYPPTGTGKFPDSFAVRGNGAPYQVPLRQGRFAVNPSDRGNYHWIMARAETPGAVYVASTVRYFSVPGPAPTEMLQTGKSELEIVPDPLPREHWQYREGETWKFRLRFRGKPLPDATVLLLNEHGARFQATSDAQGVARVTFPSDIPHVRPDGSVPHGGQKVRFLLLAEQQEGGKRYLTTFNYTYAPSPLHGKSLLAGAGFMLLGGLLAMPLLRKPRRRNEERAHV